MKFLDALKAKRSSAENLRTALAEAEEASRAAEREIEALTERRAHVLLTGTDEDAATVDAEIARAQRAADRADLAAGELRNRLTEAEAAEAEAERKRRYDEAARLGAEARKALEEYPALAQKIVDIFQSVAAADKAIEAANADRPADAPALSSPELDVRGYPATPRETLSDRVIKAWFYAGQHESWGAVEPELVDRIQRDASGRSGILPRLDGAGGSFGYRVELRRVREVEILEGQRSWKPAPLAQGVALPPLRITDPQPWPPRRPESNGDPRAARGRKKHREVLDDPAAA